jgi:ATP-binding cassette subfamily C protein CydC
VPDEAPAGIPLEVARDADAYARTDAALGDGLVLQGVAARWPEPQRMPCTRWI